ncbi:flavodoxin [uncultured Ruminococcus sp.]|uniref:flavodoxin n=1 Tax=uncultured Ruminococcus sp. TaxID=165186 RepID=UPI00345230E0
MIQTFLESGDFSGKRIILFATSGGSGFGKTASDLKPSVSDSATIENGQMLNGSLSGDALKRWADSL